MRMAAGVGRHVRPLDRDEIAAARPSSGMEDPRVALEPFRGEGADAGGRERGQTVESPHRRLRVSDRLQHEASEPLGADEGGRPTGASGPQPALLRNRRIEQMPLRLVHAP